MSKREPKLILEDISESISKILSYVDDMSFEEFSIDKKTIDAVARNFEIIGEAVNLLPSDLKEKYNQVNWRQIRGFRNRIIHEYFGIDIMIIWNIIQNYIENFKIEIDKILKEI